MGNNKKNKTTIGLFIAVVLSFLAVAFVNASTEQKKQTLPQDVAQLNGSPDTAVRPVAPLSDPLIRRGLVPVEVYPPYTPRNFPWDSGMTGLVTISNTNGIHFIDPRTKSVSEIMLNEYDYTEDPDTGGPIGGPLGSEGGGRFDLVMSRDGRLAAISNFGDSTVYIVDLSTGSPVVLGKIEIDFFAEDMDFTPDGQWLFVTDGGFASRIARIHVPTRKWVPADLRDHDNNPATPMVDASWQIPTFEIPNPNYDPTIPGSEETIEYQPQAQAIDIAPNGRTVLVADYWNCAVHALILDPATGDLSYSETVEFLQVLEGDGRTEDYWHRPINVSISPDGRTALAASANTFDDSSATPDDDLNRGNAVPVIRIDGIGRITHTGYIQFSKLVRGSQSIVFSRDGRKAFVGSNNVWDEDYEPVTAGLTYHKKSEWIQHYDVQVLAITGPGQARAAGSIRTPTKRGTSQLFGVDTLATSPDGRYLFVSNPTISGGDPVIDVVDVNSYAMARSIGLNEKYPDPLRNGYDPPDPPDPTVSGDWLMCIPAGIAFPETPIYLSLEALDAPAKVAIDEPFTFRILLSNLRVGYACGIHINQLLPEGIEILSATADKGEWQADEGLWYIHELPRFFTPRPGEDQATLTVTAKGTTLGNKAFQYWINKQAGYDPNRSDDEALFTVKIADRTDLGISAQASTLTPVINSAFTLTLTVQNLGPNPAGHVTVAQPLPSTWTVSGATPSLGSYDAVSGTWTIGALAVNGSATLQLTLTGTVLGQTSLTFPVSDTDSFDPVPGNDTAPLSFEVVKVGPPLNAVLTRFENDLIFKKEWVNKLTWQHNTVNSGISSYRIMRKVKGAADSSYALLTNVSGSLTQYADRRLEASQLFTYKISAVNSQGEESPGLVVGN
jgi:uncharacterized repeat protein (TIGR01451 family)